MIHVSFHDALSPKTAQRYVRAWKYFGRLDKAYKQVCRHCCQAEIFQVADERSSFGHVAFTKLHRNMVTVIVIFNASAGCGSRRR
jgi:hypothetical protein